MPFRLWFYLTKIGGFVFATAIVLAIVFGGSRALGTVISIMTLVLIPLGLTGAVMGVLMVCDRLRMGCPFCGRSGPAGGSKAEGMWMECETCGLIHGGGRFGLKIVNEKLNDGGSLADDPDLESKSSDHPEPK
jgi:hypothetical protein